MVFANTFRTDIKNLGFRYENLPIDFAVSIGLDAFDRDNDKSINDTLKRADKALYIAKDMGKNRVICYAQ